MKHEKTPRTHTNSSEGVETTPTKRWSPWRRSLRSPFMKVLHTLYAQWQQSSADLDWFWSTLRSWSLKFQPALSFCSLAKTFRSYLSCITSFQKHQYPAAFSSSQGNSQPLDRQPYLQLKKAFLLRQLCSPAGLKHSLRVSAMALYLPISQLVTQLPWRMQTSTSLIGREVGVR